jgi:selenobiotic family peptide radical SAM maturase
MEDLRLSHPEPVELATVYPVTSRLLAALPQLDDPMGLPEFLGNNSDLYADHPFLPDLAAVERARYRVENFPEPLVDNPKQRIINPSLELVPVRWQNLVDVLLNQGTAPGQGEENILVFKKPGTEDVRILPAGGHELLALKLIAEDIDSKQAALEGEVSVGTIDDILYTAVTRGLLIAPKSRIVRAENFPRGAITDPAWFSSPTFTLQWHITQVCDLHCRHCYDRSDRTTMELEQGIRILDDLYDFCQAHHVFTQVTFTGGNPMLYPHFIELYQAAAERGFMTAVLGNPMPRHRIEEMLTIQKPEFYQVSLEGLQEHNDYIRGEGHFDRIFNFLDLLKELDIYSMVMLTLTRLNMGEVLDLAELLRDRVNLFTFNRLAMVGEGAALASAPIEEFPAFLKEYMQAAATNPCMSLKDNFFNLLRHEQNLPYVGGCAGFGCGAAFNFVSLLPDGEVHACRKLPSHIGNMFERSLNDIYHDEPARRYRAGSAACSTCDIRPVCGGCLAVNYGFGNDIFNDLDPYCWAVN